MSTAEMTKAESVKPEIGLFELPTRPTRYPATAANRMPRINMTTVSTKAPPVEAEKYL